MKIFQKYNVKNLDNGNFVVTRPRYNYPDQIRVVSDEFKIHSDAYNHSNALNLKIVKEKKKKTIFNYEIK